MAATHRLMAVGCESREEEEEELPPPLPSPPRLPSPRTCLAVSFSAALLSFLLLQAFTAASPPSPRSPISSPLLSTPTIRLSNNLSMPMLLLGTGATTWMNDSLTAIQVAAGLLSGFPGIDTANHYRNQRGVAHGIALARSRGWAGDLWLQSKVEGCGASVDPRSPILAHRCREGTRAALLSNLEELGVDSVDLTLLHSPPCIPNASWLLPAPGWPGGCGGNPRGDLVYPHRANCSHPQACRMMREQWKAMEGAYAEGLTRAIGVSNFCADCLACIAGEAEVFPHVNQMRMHAGMGGGDPKGVVSATERTGAVLQAYQPLAHGEGSLLTDPTVRRIAASLNKSAAQVALKWVLQLGHPLVTSTESESHMRADLDVVDWQLTPAHMASLTALDTHPEDPTPMCLF